jgi:hypothetical protein
MGNALGSSWGAPGYNHLDCEMGLALSHALPRGSAPCPPEYPRGGCGFSTDHSTGNRCGALGHLWGLVLVCTCPTTV